MQILIIGGTRFLGRHLVDAALAEGHEVTLFHRGRTNPDLYPELEHLLGDRAHDLNALEGRRWDAVIDTCGYTPAAVRFTTKLLQSASSHYTFISTISVYRHPLEPGSDESAPVAVLADGASPDQMSPENYGELKALCERQVDEVFAGRSLIVRAGLLVGPFDPTDRFTYWIDRIADGGEVVAPASPDRRVQFIHARDLADWIVRSVAAGMAGTFNVTGPEPALSMGELLFTIQKELRSGVTLDWIPEEFLLEQGVAPWSDLPLWLPRSDNSFMEASVRRALDTGLVFRPLEQTIRETHRWHIGRDASDRLAAGWSRSREEEVLRAWRSSSKGDVGELSQR